MLASALTASRMSGRIASVAAALVALALPLGYFGVGYGALGSSVATTAQIKSEIVNQSISASPDLWRFEDHRLRELLIRFPVQQEHETVHIVGATGEVIAASDEPMEEPVIVRTAPLFDSGEVVGHVEVRHSLRELLMGTGVALLLGALLGGVLISVLRSLWARERELVDSMFDEHERARVTLHSIGDAVITTDAAERVEYLNPVAERLTQWTLAEAHGRPLAEVCPLIDEVTREPAAGHVGLALRDNVICNFDGTEVALVRRDGSALSIEDSASPIHDRNGRVIGAAMVFHDVTETRRLAQRISWAATHDALTGLVNRREFESRVDAALLSARNSGLQHVMCYLDLDQFKVVNDTCGHAAGDGLLKHVSALLQSKLRESDTLARLGGDEFGVLLEGCGLERAELIATELLSAISDFRYVRDGKVFSVSVSIGLVEMTADLAGRAEVFGAADTACYMAKEQGRDRVCVFHSSDAEMVQRRSEMGWSSRLTCALDEDRFTLYYQPYLALGTPGVGDRQHIEILLRLIDEQGEIVLPGSFIPAAERYNVMPAIDRWVVQTVFARYHDLAAQMGPNLTCAINLSGTTLNSAGFLGFIQQQAALHMLPTGAVCFEITESAAINNLRHATQFMKDVKALGFSFALDDFGVGTSSFAYLKNLPVDYLKIDGSFVRDIGSDPVDRAMAETINRVGHIMGLRTVGEYAESDAVIGELRMLGVDFAQGYGVQRPEPLPQRQDLTALAA